MMIMLCWHILCVEGFQRKVLLQLESLKVMLKDMQTCQGHLTAKVDHLMRVSGGSGGEAELPDDVQFPLTSLQQVDQLEEQLRDENLKNLIVSNLAVILYLSSYHYV